MNPTRNARRRPVLRPSLFFALVLCLFTASAWSSDVAPIPGGELRIDTPYSKVILRERGSVRVLYFVRDSGEQVVESAMDTGKPHRLLLGYTRSMFASYLFVPKPRKVLIVGLGAGSMVRFLQHHDPQLEIVSIDIDPKMLEIANEYFGTKPSERVRLEVADGIEFLRRARERFDVIYMDAFLKPSEETDVTGIPLAMKTRAFYQRIRANLTEDGAVVFNINLHEKATEDLAVIRSSFPSTYVLRVPDSGNIIAIATLRGAPVRRDELRAQGRLIDARLAAPFSIEALVNDLRGGE